MAISVHEPCTKFYGPNRRYQPIPGNNVRVKVEVFNLLRGATWNALWEAELFTPRLLVPHVAAQVYIYVSAHFLWAMYYTFTRTELIVRQSAPGLFAFRFNPKFLCVNWCKNELISPTGNYAYGGTATMSWIEV